MTSIKNSARLEQTQAGENIILAIGQSQSKIALLSELAERHQFRVVVADASRGIGVIPAFAIVANPTQLTKDQFDLLLASQEAAARVLFTENPPWKIPSAVKDAVIVDRELFRDTGVLTFRILVRQKLYGQKPIKGTETRIYTLVRRYFHLDRERLRFSVQRDELVEVLATNIDDAFERAIKEINAREGTVGLVPNQGRTDDDPPYIGLHADRELQLPQLPSMERMHLDGDSFDILFYPEGGKYHGDGHDYLHIQGRVFTAASSGDQLWYFATEDQYLEDAFQPAYEFTGRLLAFCLDRCKTDAGEITRECWLYRTDDGHYLLHSATDHSGRAIYRNASARAVLKRAERFLADGTTTQSAAFLRDAAQVMRLMTMRKGER